jgi:hypothetical protein
MNSCNIGGRRRPGTTLARRPYFHALFFNQKVLAKGPSSRPRCKLVRMTSGEIEQIVGSVLKYYGLQLTVRHVMFHDDRWLVLLIPPDGSPVHVTLPDSRPQDVRAALISALEVEE